MIGTIYFVQEGATGAVKIGFTTWEVHKRISMLQVGSSHHLILRKAMVGTAFRERDLHREFAEHRIRGEWFRPAVLDCPLPERLITLDPPPPSCRPSATPIELVIDISDAFPKPAPAVIVPPVEPEPTGRPRSPEIVPNRLRLPHARRRFLTVRFTTEELQALRAQADALGVDLRPWARDRILRGLRIPT